MMNIKFSRKIFSCQNTPLMFILDFAKGITSAQLNIFLKSKSHYLSLHINLLASRIIENNFHCYTLIYKLYTI